MQSEGEDSSGKEEDKENLHVLLNTKIEDFANPDIKNKAELLAKYVMSLTEMKYQQPNSEVVQNVYSKIDSFFEQCFYSKLLGDREIFEVLKWNLLEYFSNEDILLEEKILRFIKDFHKLSIKEFTQQSSKRKNEPQINKVCWGEDSDGKKRYMSKSVLVIFYFDGYRFLIDLMSKMILVHDQFGNHEKSYWYLEVLMKSMKFLLENKHSSHITRATIEQILIGITTMPDNDKRKEYWGRFEKLLTLITPDYCKDEDIVNLPSLLYIKARYYVTFEKYSEALKTLNKVKKIQAQNPKGLDTSVCLNTPFLMAIVNEKMDRLPDALKLYAKIIDYYSTYQDTRILKYSLFTIGKHKYKDGDFNTAFHMLTQFFLTKSDPKFEFYCEFNAWNSFIENRNSQIIEGKEMLDDLLIRLQDSTKNIDISFDPACSKLEAYHIMEEISPVYYQDVIVSSENAEEHLRKVNIAFKLNEQIYPNGLPSKELKEIFLVRAKIHYRLQRYEDAVEDFLKFYLECNKCISWKKGKAILETPKIGLSEKCGHHRIDHEIDNNKYFKHLVVFYKCIEKLDMYEEAIPILRMAHEARARADEKSYHEMLMSIGLLCKTVHNMPMTREHCQNDIPIEEEMISKISSSSDRENTTYALSYLDYLKARSMFKFNCANPNRIDWNMSKTLFEAGIVEYLDPRVKELKDCGMNGFTEPNKVHALEKDALKLWHISICHHHLGNVKESFECIMKSLSKCNDLINQMSFTSKYMDAIKLTMTFIALKNGNANSIQYTGNSVKNHIQEIMEPQSNYSKLAITFKRFSDDSDTPDFLNCISTKSKWNLLTYSSDTVAKKHWRYFKNSSLITSYVRKQLFNSMRIESQKRSNVLSCYD